MIIGSRTGVDTFILFKLSVQSKEFPLLAKTGDKSESEIVPIQLKQCWNFPANLTEVQKNRHKSFCRVGNRGLQLHHV